MFHVFITALIAMPLYVLLLLVHPVHRCPDCRGRKSVPHGTGRRPCTRCKTTGRTYRRGAIVTHRLIREHAWPWLRDRISDKIAARIGGDS